MDPRDKDIRKRKARRLTKALLGWVTDHEPGEELEFSQDKRVMRQPARIVVFAEPTR